MSCYLRSRHVRKLRPPSQPRPWYDDERKHSTYALSEITSAKCITTQPSSQLLSIWIVCRGDVDAVQMIAKRGILDGIPVQGRMVDRLSSVVQMPIVDSRLQALRPLKLGLDPWKQRIAHLSH
ncbi:hypothetical protein BDV95DRAFT_558405 [Massariosphaeria phaeospora]|uniref:Uncharacterized protein n=1 Tax=Massariosphaeria phaeospora TaxID=100035 RepID=A0A7C8MGM6_9PLEO|nr:hypothetical protein BDV95DRAFT_558405 [Massariosphaeria phaeospora]